MSAALRHYIVTEHVIGSAIVNFLLNALIAWVSFRHMVSVPLWGRQSIGGDLIGTTIILPVLTCLIVTRIVRGHLRRGRIAASDLAGESLGLLRTLPGGSFTRGLALAGITTALAAPFLLVLLSVAGVASLDFRTFVLFKATYAGLLAAMVQPAVALRAIMDGADGLT